MIDVNEIRKLFRKRDAYTIFFVPYFMSNTGILFEFVNAPETVGKQLGFTIRIEDLEKFGKTLMTQPKSAMLNRFFRVTRSEIGMDVFVQT